MTEKQFSSAMVQFAEHTKRCSEATDELNKGLATFFLNVPMGMSYELWRYLHQVKGDWIE